LSIACPEAMPTSTVGPGLSNNLGTKIIAFKMKVALFRPNVKKVKTP
jgi:hypothetical protein